MTIVSTKPFSEFYPGCQRYENGRPTPELKQYVNYVIENGMRADMARDAAPHVDRNTVMHDELEPSITYMLRAALRKLNLI